MNWAFVDLVSFFVINQAAGFCSRPISPEVPRKCGRTQNPSEAIGFIQLHVMAPSVQYRPHMIGAQVGASFF